MNERIKELAEQAGASYGDAYDLYLLEEHIEKFAELIVADCRDMFIVNSPSWNLLNEKLEHFGVVDSISIRGGDVITEDNIVWWRCGTGPEKVLAGAHWANIKEFPELYQVEKPTIQSVTYYDE